MQSVGEGLALRTWVRVYRRVVNLNVLDNNNPSWVPSACTLPTAEQPLRVAEFDALFTQDALVVTRTSTGLLSIDVRPEAAGRVATLAVKETHCCSFFSFELKVSGGEVSLSVSTEPAHAEVLAALAERAERLVREAGR